MGKADGCYHYKNAPRRARATGGGGGTFRISFFTCPQGLRPGLYSVTTSWWGMWRVFRGLTTKYSPRATGKSHNFAENEREIGYLVVCTRKYSGHQILRTGFSVFGGQTTKYPEAVVVSAYGRQHILALGEYFVVSPQNTANGCLFLSGLNQLTQIFYCSSITHNRKSGGGG